MSAPVLSAIAAACAAVLAGLNLFVTGRREQTKWSREVLVDTLAEFLTASYRCKDECKQAAAMKRAGLSDDDLKSHLDAASAVYDEQKDALTRLRLLAPPSVVKAANAVRYRNKDYLTFATEGLNGDIEQDRKLRCGLGAAREEALQAARRFLKIP
ncbi:hypothetical protein [Nonomuraea sp. NEAU-A123]|uniref:hypothetical protein n=1 Tax=Nonomuraea sp. NEAU-A123 TaxID=2839649 RepID=UPI001BE4DDA9|nr:hypothetical protein [Nonomuraea sp. NEAU-A123]MBT2232199.1 hypothetical protein [Nonomuraea sp. NEAU-A123]